MGGDLACQSHYTLLNTVTAPLRWDNIIQIGNLTKSNCSINCTQRFAGGFELFSKDEPVLEIHSCLGVHSLVIVGKTWAYFFVKGRSKWFLTLIQRSSNPIYVFQVAYPRF